MVWYTVLSPPPDCYHADSDENDDYEDHQPDCNVSHDMRCTEQCVTNSSLSVPEGTVTVTVSTDNEFR